MLLSFNDVGHCFVIIKSLNSVSTYIWCTYTSGKFKHAALILKWSMVATFPPLPLTCKALLLISNTT